VNKTPFTIGKNHTNHSHDNSITLAEQNKNVEDTIIRKKKNFGRIYLNDEKCFFAVILGVMEEHAINLITNTTL
jgi:hypothetical protein